MFIKKKTKLKVCKKCNKELASDNKKGVCQNCYLKSASTKNKVSTVFLGIASIGVFVFKKGIRKS